MKLVAEYYTNKHPIKSQALYARSVTNHLASSHSIRSPSSLSSISFVFLITTELLSSVSRTIITSTNVRSEALDAAW